MKLLRRARSYAVVTVAILAIFLCGVRLTARQASEKKSEAESKAQEAPAADTQHVPPYFKSAKAAKPLPAVLPASRFDGRPVVVRAYEIAAKIPKVLAQEPCYCGCDKHFGHHCLLDCYASDHTAGCAVCVKEAFLAYEMTKLGKSPAQIREAIIRGDWKQVDLNHPPELTP
jgi:Protein of unknown function with PCYCGC motif